MTLKSSTGLCPLNFHWVTSAIPFPCKQARLKEAPPPTPEDMGIQHKPRSTLQELLESQPGENAPGMAAQTRLPTPPPPHPSNLSDLNPPTLKEKGSRKAKRWWKEEKPTPPKWMRPKGGPSKLRWGKRALTKGVMFRSHLRLGPPPQCWIGLPCPPVPS